MSLSRSEAPRFEVAPGSQVRFIAGRWLLWRAAGAIASAPERLSVAERHALQRRWATRLLRHLRVRLTIEGAERLPSSPHVIVALHEGMVDALCLLMLDRPMRFVARREIFTMPGIGAAIARMGHLPIDPERGASAYRMLRRQGGNALAAGEDLVIFAQGTLLGVETELRAGAFHIASALQRPLLPIALTGTHRIWEHPFSPELRYRQPVTLRVLPPVQPGPPGRAQVERLRASVQRSLKAAAMAPGAAPPRRYRPERDGWWDGYSFEIDPAFDELRSALAAHRRAEVASERHDQAGARGLRA
jgi:1-acyl-sn-glycerol-3-phosphate acyltransferase